MAGPRVSMFLGAQRIKKPGEGSDPLHVPSAPSNNNRIPGPPHDGSDLRHPVFGFVSAADTDVEYKFLKTSGAQGFLSEVAPESLQHRPQLVPPKVMKVQEQAILRPPSSEEDKCGGGDVAIPSASIQAEAMGLFPHSSDFYMNSRAKVFLPAGADQLNAGEWGNNP